MNNLVYRGDILKAVSDDLKKFIETNPIYHKSTAFKVLKLMVNDIKTAPSSYWHPCDDENNVPPTGEEVLVTLEYPNGKKEIAFGEHWGENMNANIARWGGQNGLVMAWARKPKPYEGEKKDD